MSVPIYASLKAEEKKAIAFSDVMAELSRATAKHGSMCSAHEGYAVILEEMDELKAEVWKQNRDTKALREEAIQLAAMAVRFVIDVCEEEG